MMKRTNKYTHKRNKGDKKKIKKVDDKKIKKFTRLRSEWYYRDNNNNSKKNSKEIPGSKPLTTGKTERFCQEYLIDLCIKDAGERAGYKKGTASSYIYGLMAKPEVLERISYLQYKRARRLEISQERVLQEIASIAFFNIKDLYLPNGVLKNISSLTRREAAAITGVDFHDGKANKGRLKKVHHDGKQSALMSLGKHLGMFQERSGFTDPLIYELRERKAKLQNLSEEDLIALSRIMRKAVDPTSDRDGVDKGVDNAGDGSGYAPGGKTVKTLH